MNNLNGWKRAWKESEITGGRIRSPEGFFWILSADGLSSRQEVFKLPLFLTQFLVSGYQIEHSDLFKWILEWIIFEEKTGYFLVI